MLENWQVGRFRSIVNPYDFALADITLLTGENNTGKSSLLQSIVLIAQTLGSSSGNEQLLFQGRMLDLGTVKDIANGVTTTIPLTFRFKLGPSLTKAYVPSASRSHGSSSFHEESLLPEHSVEVTLDFGLVSIPTNEYLDVDSSLGTGGNYVKSDKLPLVKSLKIVVDAARDGDEQIVFSAESTLKENEGLYHDHPRTRYQGHLEFNGQKEFSEYPITFVRFLPVDLKRAFHVSTPRTSSRHSSPASPLAASIERVEKAIAEIKRFFSKGVCYLGVPRSYAPMSPPLAVMDDHVGSHGEFAATVYENHCADPIDWYDPIRQGKTRSPLADAVDRWLQYLGVAHRVGSKRVGSKGKDSYRWQVAHRENQDMHPLSSGSVAVGQVLPLLVMGLLAPKETLLLVEQPELCLHQRAQARLGDFFAGLVQCGKQCLIETHSENLVTQLRYHIVREGGHDPDKYMIYFAEQDKDSAQFTPIEISPRGNILNWSEGFFDETSFQEENMSIAYLKRKTEEAREEKLRR